MQGDSRRARLFSSPPADRPLARPARSCPAIRFALRADRLRRERTCL